MAASPARRVRPRSSTPRQRRRPAAASRCSRPATDRAGRPRISIRAMALLALGDQNMPPVGFAYLNGDLTMATAWSRAARLADRTPASRNRYVDFLRAASMLVVPVGHWLAAAPYFDPSGELIGAHILTVVPWTAWLTWIVQVMPIFFIVGGYANGVSWRAARRDGRSYATWLESRLRRLVWPLLPLLVAWVAIAARGYARGLRP